MTKHLPTIGLILVTNPDLVPPASQLPKIVIFQEGQQYHIPDSEKQWLQQALQTSLNHLYSKHHQAVLVAVEVRPGTKIDAYLYSTPQPDASGRRRHRRRRTTCD